MATDHFVKHSYQKGHIDWNFNVLFNSQPQVAQMAEQYAPVLDHPGLYSVAPPWLHSTILRVGFLEDYTEQEMRAVAKALEPKLAALQLPEFVFDSWWLWGGNVILHITPDDQFGKIYDVLIEELKGVVGSQRFATSPHGHFIAHTSLAYSRTYDQERAIHQRLSEHPIKSVAFNATHLSLIKQWPTDGHYEWEIVEEIPIGR